MNIYEKLLAVQVTLKAPKLQYNKFGNFFYRSCEDILLAAKPLLENVKCLILLEDELVMIGDRYYIKATATFADCESTESILCHAYAREDETRKGMDSSQLTGSTSSYARKYALNGLLSIDDSKEADDNEFAEIEKGELIDKFWSEIKRTGKSYKYFLREASAGDINELTPDFLQNALTMLGKLPSKPESDKK